MKYWVRSGSCIAVIAISASAAASPTVAMNGHLPSEADIAAIEAVGATSVRMDFNWWQFNPSPATWDWTAIDAAVTSARAHNLAIYATVAYTPQWASSVPSCVPGSADDTLRCDNKLPTNMTDWTTAVTEVVSRYAGQIDCWGIWNEPNLRTFFEGSQDEFVDQIFIPAANAIRAADPAGRICGPELAGLTASSAWNGTNGTCVGDNCIRNGWEIDLGEMLDRVGSHLDVVTQHMYKADAAGVMIALLDGEYFGSLLTHDAVRRVIADHEAGDKEFWLTETGWEIVPGDPDSLDVAAMNIADLYTRQEQVCAGSYEPSSGDPWRNWTRTFFYDLQSIHPEGTALSPYTSLQAWSAEHRTTLCGGNGAGDDARDAGPGSGGSPVNDAAPGGVDADRTGGCGCGSANGAGGSTGFVVLLLIGALVWARRQRTSPARRPSCRQRSTAPFPRAPRRRR